MQRAATARTASRLDIDYQLDPRQMRGQRAAVALRRFGARARARAIRALVRCFAGRRRGIEPGLLFRQGLLEIVDALFQLIVVEPLRAAAEAVSLQTGHQQRSRSISASAARRISCNVAGSSGRGGNGEHACRMNLARESRQMNYS